MVLSSCSALCALRHCKGTMITPPSGFLKEQYLNCIWKCTVLHKVTARPTVTWERSHHRKRQPTKDRDRGSHRLPGEVFLLHNVTMWALQTHFFIQRSSGSKAALLRIKGSIQNKFSQIHEVKFNSGTTLTVVDYYGKALYINHLY